MIVASRTISVTFVFFFFPFAAPGVRKMSLVAALIIHIGEEFDLPHARNMDEKGNEHRLNEHK